MLTASYASQKMHKLFHDNKRGEDPAWCATTRDLEYHARIIKTKACIWTSKETDCLEIETRKGEGAAFLKADGCAFAPETSEA